MLCTKYFEQLLPRTRGEFVPVSKAKMFFGIDPKNFYKLFEVRPDLFDYIRPGKTGGKTLHVHTPSYEAYRRKHDA